MMCRTLTALPVYNEAEHVAGVVAGALCYCHEVLVVDDGSTDGTAEMLNVREDVHLVRHPANLGYGAALRSAFDFAIRGGYDILATIDCDGQHQPQLIPKFVERCGRGDADIVSGSRYLRRFAGDSEPPPERHRINRQVTAELNHRLGLNLTDAFCGFKAYRVAALAKLRLTETGYAMPLELWTQAARLGLRVVEVAVPLVYLDASRSFGALDDATTRLAVYRTVLDRAARGFKPRRLHAPQENGASLIEPPFDEAADLIGSNRRIRDESSYDMQGRSLAEISRLARAELLDAARRWTAAYRDVPAAPFDPRGEILLTGHQPRMFHPGVWCKNFALSALANSRGAAAVHVIIDTDVASDASLRVPGGSLDQLRVADIAFDRAEPRIPFEERRIEDRELFASFGDRVVERMTPLAVDPLMARYWPMVLERAEHGDNIGACLAQARHRLEADFSACTLEVPLGSLCRGEAFSWFVAHLAAQLPRFRAAYNDSLREYRRLYGERSIAHPAPDLAEDGEWIETPFWIWTADDPRRRGLFARHAGREVLLTDRRSWRAALPLETDGDAARAVERLVEMQRGNVRIRPRALATTLWTRLALGDLFIHGVGGSQYDRATNRIIERFFDIAAPRFMAVSATLRLPIERRRGAGGNRAASDRILAWREYAFCLYPEATLRELFSKMPSVENTAPC